MLRVRSLHLCKCLPMLRFLCSCAPKAGTRSCSKVVAMATKPIIIFVLGAPGSGKGTQSANIVKDFGFIHLSAGDLLRAERNTKSEVSTLIEKYIKEGQIVPVEITVGLLEKAMDQSSTKKFLIDGFPRNEDNLEGWKRVMDEKTDVRFVLFFDCTKEACVSRCLERGKTGGRADDNKESLEKRFVTYFNQTKPIIDQYEAKGLVRTINATESADMVFEEVQKLFKNEGF